MARVLEATSTLTDRFQTTVPEPVRRALNLQKRDKLSFVIRDDGSVVVERAGPGDDPVVGAFLAFLAKDMRAHPERIGQLDPALVARAKDLSREVAVDLDAPLSSDPD